MSQVMDGITATFKKRSTTASIAKPPIIAVMTNWKRNSLHDFGIVISLAMITPIDTL